MRIYILSKFKNQRVLDEGWVTQTLNELHLGDVTHGSNVKKLSGFVEPVYSIRGTLKARLVFTYGLYQGELSIFLLDILPNHDIPKNNTYDAQVRMVHELMSGVVLPSEEPDSKAILSALANTVPAPVYEFNHSGLILSEEQNQLIQAKFPLLLNGPPGSGKTSGLFILLLELIEQGNEDSRYLYITQTKSLALFLNSEWERSGYGQRSREKNCRVVFRYAQCLFYQDVDEHFLYYSLLDKGTLEQARSMEKPVPLMLEVAETRKWFDKKLKELSKRPGMDKVVQIRFDSFIQEKDVLCGYSREVYLSDEFGKRNSFFEPSLKKTVYNVYEEYLDFIANQMKERQVFDLKLCRVSEEEPYTIVLSDETQDSSLCQLQNYKQLSINSQIVMSIDSNQDLEKGLSLRTHIKGLFTRDDECFLNSLSLVKCFRCPEPVIELANCLITLKNKVTGGVTDKDEYSSFQKAVVKEKGDVLLVTSQTLSQSNTLLNRFKDTEVVVVAHEDKKTAAQKLFPNYTVWTPKQVKGMESPCVIGYQLFDRAYFKQANTLLGQASEKVNVNRAKSGEARPAYAPDFNSVLTAFTRTQKALIVVEDKVNDLPHLLAPIKKIIDQANQKTPQATKTVQQSVKTTVDDWKKQVDGLLAQGKHQMAEEVFNQRLKATLPLSFAEYQARYRSSQGKILNSSVDLESHPNKAEPNKSQPETKITSLISNKACDNKNENNKGAQKLPSTAKKKKNKQSALPVIKDIQQPIPSRILSLPLPTSPQQPQFLSATQVLSKKEGLINKASGLLNRFTESFLGVFFKFEELLHYRRLPLPEFNNLTLLDAVFTDKNKRVVFEHFLSKEPRLIRKFFTKFELDTIDFIACQPRKSKCIKYLFNEHTENLTDLLCQFNDSGFLINNLVTGYGHGLLASAVHKENEEYVAFLLKIKDLDVNKSGAVHAFAPLMIAIENGNMNIVDLLLNSPGIDVNKVDKEGYSPLLIAHNNRRVEAVRRLLDHPGINLKNGSLLRIACQYGHVQAVERLLMAPSVNINQTSLDGSTLLLLACEQGHVGVAKLLLGYPGIDINKANKHGVSPLYIACQNGLVELVQLLSAYPELKVNDTAYCGVSPFYIACQKEHIEIIKLLAARPDIDLNKANEHGITPLNVACQKGDIETMTLLLGRPAIQVNKADTVYGDTPLHIACKKENLKAIQLLIAHPDIKVGEVNKHGSTPLYISCQRRDSKAIKLLLEHSPVWITEGRDNDKLFRLACQDGNSEMVKLFLEHSNIEINKAGEHGETLLSTACAKGDVRLIRLLLTHPTIDVNKANNNKATPLLVACANGHVAVVKLLLAYSGIKVNEADEDGETPLFIACHNGFADVVKLLLAYPGIEANKAEKKNGDTPLFIACQHGVMGAVKLLVEHPETEINKKSKDGVTPFYMACQSSFLPVVKLLLHSNHLDVNQVEPGQQYTPLLVSCLSPATRKNRELFRLLLENKANLYHKNSKGETALDIAFSQKNNAAVEEILSYAKKENLPLVSLMSSKTQEVARDWAFSLDLLLADHNRFFASHPLLDLKQFVQQQLPDVEHPSVAQQKSKIYANS